MTKPECVQTTTRIIEGFSLCVRKDGTGKVSLNSVIVQMEPLDFDVMAGIIEDLEEQEATRQFKFVTPAELTKRVKAALTEQRKVNGVAWEAKYQHGDCVFDSEEPLRLGIVEQLTRGKVIHLLETPPAPDVPFWGMTTDDVLANRLRKMEDGPALQQLTRWCSQAMDEDVAWANPAPVACIEAGIARRDAEFKADRDSIAEKLQETVKTALDTKRPPHEEVLRMMAVGFDVEGEKDERQ